MCALKGRLREGPPLVMDGGLATELERRGHVLDARLWSAGLLLDDPDAIVGVHRAYLEAGAHVLITASYQATVDGLATRGLSAREAAGVIGQSVTLARRACDARTDVVVAGSLGTFGASRADGAEYRGRYGLTRDAYTDHHAPRLDALLEAGADVIACETLPDLDEAAALIALLESRAATGWLAFTCADDARLRGGARVEEAWSLASVSRSVVAAGVNCTAPEHVRALLERARGNYDGPLLCYPNSGEGWDGASRRWTGDARGHALADLAPDWVAAGARLVGGCCRTGPEDIARLARVLHGDATDRAPPRT